jgi:hypothetical protein
MNTQIFANRMVSQTVNLSQFQLLIIAYLGMTKVNIPAMVFKLGFLSQGSESFPS